MIRAVILIIEKASEKKVLIKPERSPQSYAGLNTSGSVLEKLLLI
jgi:hypothetical protein